MISPRSESSLTLVLTSRENFVWHSMQEIIPAIERAWQLSEVPGIHEIRCVNIDRIGLKELVPALLKSENVVQTCFTYKMCTLGRMMRRDLHLDSRWIIHLHNQATIACWPFHKWGMGEHLTEDDIFVSSCGRDARTLVLSHPTATCAVVPFSNPEQEELSSRSEMPGISDPVPLFYVGRLSSQKNLHTFLYALRLWLDAAPRKRVHLEFFGQEDHLGSPNMGLPCKSYMRTLQKLVSELRLENHVRFRGHLDRKELYREIFAKKHILISPSLHSDENFGMAAFRSLCAGNIALLSDWGGHADFSDSFQGSVVLAPVRETSAGPAVCPRELATRLDEAVARYEERTPALFPQQYSESAVAARLRDLALRPRKTRNKLLPSALGRRVISNRDLFSAQDSRSMRIFHSYSDPDAAAFFRSYGMKARDPNSGAENKRPGRLVPWARRSKDGTIVAQDPHRGLLEAKTLEEAFALGIAHPESVNHED